MPYLAVDIVTILATVEKISCELKWNFCYKLSILVYTFINIRFQPKVSSGYGPFHRESHGHGVIKEWIFLLRIEPILENHVEMVTNRRLLRRLASAREKKSRGEEDECDGCKCHVIHFSIKNHLVITNSYDSS